MNSLKRPETVITLVNTAALLGISIYFYRKTNNLELELNKHSEHLTATVKKVKEIANTKKYLAQLANAIKELNNYSSVYSRDIDNLKEIIKYQNTQIAELQAFVLTLRGEDNKSELKLKENPHIFVINPFQRFPPQISQFPGQNVQQQNIQQFPGQNVQQFPGQNPQQQNQNAQNPMRQLPQPQQAFPQQGFAQPQMQPVQPQQAFPQQQMQQQFPQQMQQQFPQQQMQQQFPQQMSPQQNQFGQQNFNSFDGIDDEDAAIAAVRSAKQQNMHDTNLDNFFLN